MAATRTKICGITTRDALDAAIAARADYVGVNLYAPSPRFADMRTVAALAARSAGRVPLAGVFVDPDDTLIGEAVAAGGLAAIQLHGDETPDRAAQVRARFGLPVWKVLPVAAAGDIARAADYRDSTDFLLFDARTPRGALPGGMGLRFDWSLLAGYRGALPWGLAGGLTPENVGEAIRATGAPLVDTSSGVESAPGVKDAAKIAAFCDAVRRA